MNNYKHMYELDRIKDFFSSYSLLSQLSDERIEYLYKKISNPKLRVNDKDKQWVAGKQRYEVQHTINEVSEIVYPDNLLQQVAEEPTIKILFNKVCDLFNHYSIIDKPRIPFYILMLDELLD